MTSRTFYTTFFLFVAYSLLAQESHPLEAILQKGHSKLISCYAFSPDSRYLATGSQDNSIILWNIENGRQIRVFNRHSEAVQSLFFSPDGSRILSSSSDNTAKVFDVLTGKQLAAIKLPDGYLQLAFYSPDGKKIILYDDRDGVFVYDAVTLKLQLSLNRSYSI